MMKLVDTNVWLALTLSKHALHRASRDWLDETTSQDLLLFCRSTQQSYLRLLTTAQVLAPYGNPPLSNSQAWQAYQTWVQTEGVSIVEEPADLEENWKAAAVRDTASPKLWMDAYLAAFAMSAGYQLVTTDNAFKQFKGLELRLLSSV